LNRIKVLHGEDDQEIRPAAKDLRNLRQAVCLAEKVGEGLGIGQILF